MRITGGRLRGRTISAPKRSARPTTDRTREAIFNLLQARMDLPEARALDLYAGSGALGLEAISRGAANVVLVDRGREALAALRANCEALGLADQCSIVRADVLRFLARHVKPAFDLILADPPYDDPHVATLHDAVLPLLNPGGIFVLEHDPNVDFGDHPLAVTSRRYGDTAVTLFDAG